jgi:enoyl-CoA hydratase/carnithine racemase
MCARIGLNLASVCKLCERTLKLGAALSSRPFATIQYAVEQSVATLTLDRPDARNAINNAMRADLVAALAMFGADDNARVLVLTGSDCGAFCAGADLKERNDTDDVHTADAAKPQYFAALRDCPKPVIAAIDGYCVAGGLELSLLSDIRIATARSTFGMPEPKVGMIGDAAVELLARMIPLGEALRLQLTATRIDAARGYQIGLIQDLCQTRSDLMADARKRASAVLECAPSAVATLKYLIRTGSGMSLRDAIELSRPHKRQVLSSPDAAEGVRAFVEKRPPKWSPRSGSMKDLAQSRATQ